MEKMITIYLIVLAAVAGAVLGSFLNCMAIRYRTGEKITKGRSHCMSCGHVLSAVDLIPVVSWLSTGGRCRYCKEKISPRYLISELTLAAAFALTAWAKGPVPELPAYLFMEAVMFVAALCDIETMEVPDRFFLMLTGAWLVWKFLETAVINRSFDFTRDLLWSLIGGIGVPVAVFMISLAVEKAIGREALGMGDIKLLLPLGLFLGKGSLLNVMLMCVTGLVVIAVRKRLRKKSGAEPVNEEENKRDGSGTGEEAAEEKKHAGEPIPLVPAMAFSSFVTLLAGQYIIDAYTKLLI